MKILQGTLQITLAIFLLSCRSAQTCSPKPIRVRGAYIHTGSGMIFLEKVGNFQRIEVVQYTPDEKDVGIGYNLYNPTSLVVATVYVSPAPELLSIGSPPEVIETARNHLFQNHLEGVKREIIGAHPDAKLIYDDDFTLTMNKQSHKGRK